MILTEYDIQYTTQKAIKGSVLADHLAHQAVDDYHSMNFEFPDEDIIPVTDYEDLDRMKDLKKDPDGLWFLTKFPTHLEMASVLGLSPPRAVIHPSLPGYVSIVPTIWLNMKHALWVLKLLPT